MCSGAHFSVFSGMHLVRFDSVTKSSVQVKSVCWCTLQHLPSLTLVRDTGALSRVGGF